jgi:hypothetical protein
VQRDGVERDPVSDKHNRAQRRAAERRATKPKKLDGIQLLLTADEVRLVEEAMDSLRRTMREDIGEEDFDEHQKWAYARAGQLSNYLQAAIYGYTYKAPTGFRHEPGGLVAQREGTAPS